MKKEKKRLPYWLFAVLALALLLWGHIGYDYFQEEKQQDEWIARKARINELWQQYLEKDPNEEDLWAIIKNNKPYGLIDLATEAILPITNSEHRLLYLLEEHEYNTDLRIKTSDRILENPFKEGLEKIIDMVPERAENALLVLQEANPNEIGFDCLKNVIIYIPSHRKWAWDKILSNPDQIKPSLCYAFTADSNYPKEAVNLYFSPNLGLKEEHYKQLIFYCRSLDKRALKEFLIVRKPENDDLREIILGNRWDKHPEKEVKIEAGKYILINNPSERDLSLVEKKLPSLRKMAKERRKKILERKAAEQKIIPETKEEILKAIEKIAY